MLVIVQNSYVIVQNSYKIIKERVKLSTTIPSTVPGLRFRSSEIF